MPVFVFLFLEHLNPIVRNTHSHTVVKADTAGFERECKSRHTAHFLSDSDSVFVHFVDEFVCEREVCDGICVLSAVVIVAVRAECLSQTVVIV